MCRVIPVASLDSSARDFVSQFEGYGIVADDLTPTTRKEEIDTEDTVPFVREIPKPVQIRGMFD